MKEKLNQFLRLVLAQLEPVKSVINKKYILYYFGILILISGSVASYQLIKYSKKNEPLKSPVDIELKIDSSKIIAVERGLIEPKRDDYQRYLKTGYIIAQNTIFNENVDGSQPEIKDGQLLNRTFQDDYTLKSNLAELKVKKDVYNLEEENLVASNLLSNEVNRNGLEEKIIDETLPTAVGSGKIKISKNIMQDNDELNKLIREFKEKNFTETEKVIPKNIVEKVDTEIQVKEPVSEKNISKKEIKKGGVLLNQKEKIRDISHTNEKKNKLKNALSQKKLELLKSPDETLIPEKKEVIIKSAPSELRNIKEDEKNNERNVKTIYDLERVKDASDNFSLIKSLE